MIRCTFVTATGAAVFALFYCSHTFAQSNQNRFELGGHYTALSAAVRSVGDRKDLLHGFGGRFGFILMRGVDLETEVSYFPQDISSPFGDAAFRAVKPNVQVMFGMKAGKRYDRVGIFGKLRPGFVRYSPLDDCQSDNPNDCTSLSPEGQILLRTVRKNEFALDIGAVVEGYVSRRSFVRFFAMEALASLSLSNRALRFRLPESSSIVQA